MRKSDRKKLYLAPPNKVASEKHTFSCVGFYDLKHKKIATCLEIPPPGVFPFSKRVYQIPMPI